MAIERIHTIPILPQIRKPTYSEIIRTIDYRQKYILENQLSDLRRKYTGGIGFLTGCFDGWHEGHDMMMEQARGYVPNGIVVVGVNSNESVKKQNKRPLTTSIYRPINHEICRMYRVAQCRYVDYVFLFNSKTAVHLLDLLQPDVFLTFAGDDLRDKPELIHIVEHLPKTQIRINTSIPIDIQGNKISTTSTALHWLSQT